MLDQVNQYILKDSEKVSAENDEPFIVAESEEIIKTLSPFLNTTPSSCHKKACPNSCPKSLKRLSKSLS